jgi:drug/metabolite transporter (DMT)-like permease
MQFGPLLIFIAAVLWGLDGILRRSLFDLPPATIVFYEHLIGAILIAPFLWRAWKQETLQKNEWTALTLVSLLSGVLGTLFFTTALLKINFISFSVVFLLQKLQPIFTVITAWIVLGEKPGKRYLPWAALALIAGYFVTFPNGVVNLTGGEQVSAAAFAFLAAVAWGSSTAFSRYVLIGHSNTLVTGLRFVITVPLAFGFVIGFGQFDSIQAVTGTQLLTLLGIALSTGMLALWIYYRGLKTTPARISAIVELAFPMTAILIDYFLYDTALVATQYLAAAVLLYAMYKVAQLNAPQRVPEAAAQAV